MATYLADRVIVFEGQPAISATATPCVSVVDSSDDRFTHYLTLGRNLFCRE